MEKLLVFVCVILCVQAIPMPNLDDRNENQCGVEASPDLIHRNPWLVFLEYYQDGDRKYIRCGATLIGKRHVVTAAHCVRSAMFTSLIARLGEYDLATEEDCVGDVCADRLVRIKVSRITVPSTYDGREDDIAVLELEEDAPYTEYIRPVCLPTVSAGSDVTFEAAGWGEVAFTHMYSRVKKIIHLPAWTKQNCHNAYKKLTLPKKVICAGGEDGVDTCRGDSGGPLVLRVSDNFGQTRVELHGVTSSGNIHCGTEGSPGIYTSILDHMEFIEEAMS